MMKLPGFLFLKLVLVIGCRPQSRQQPADPTLAEARRGFQTHLTRKETTSDPVAVPPAKLFQIVRFESPVGKLAAYLSQPPKDGRKHPAIIWIFGGFGNSIGNDAWEPGPPENDQSASQFHQAGIITMYPSLRGGNDNPGFKEGFFGEVDDISAAAEFLTKQEFVDPQRIYLGGHSTGGTLALLVAESNQKFRAVFTLGAVGDVAGYGEQNLPFNPSDAKEVSIRSPLYWLNSIKSPVFVFEGTKRPGNYEALRELSNAAKNSQIRFYPVKGADHFSLIAPLNQLIAEKILRDEGPTTNIGFTPKELDALFSP